MMALAVRSPFTLSLVYPFSEGLLPLAVQGRMVRRFLWGDVEVRLLCPYNLVTSIDPWQRAALHHPLNLLTVPRKYLSPGSELRGFHHGLGSEYAFIRAARLEATQIWDSCPAFRYAVHKALHAVIAGWPEPISMAKSHSPWKACMAGRCQSWLGVGSYDLAAFLVVAPAVACQCLPVGLLSGEIEEVLKRLWTGFRRELKHKAKPHKDRVSTGLRWDGLEAVTCSGG